MKRKKNKILKLLPAPSYMEWVRKRKDDPILEEIRNKIHILSKVQGILRQWEFDVKQDGHALPVPDFIKELDVMLALLSPVVRIANPFNASRLVLNFDNEAGEMDGRCDFLLDKVTALRGYLIYAATTKEQEGDKYTLTLLISHLKDNERLGSFLSFSNRMYVRYARTCRVAKLKHTKMLYT